MDPRAAEVRALVALVADALGHRHAEDRVRPNSRTELVPWPPPTPWPAILREHGVEVGQPRWLGRDWPDGGEAVALDDLGAELGRLALREELARRAGEV